MHPLITFFFKSGLYKERKYFNIFESDRELVKCIHLLLIGYLQNDALGQ